MLVLRRRAGECLTIDEKFEIEILELNSQAVKLGIRAPRGATMLRQELQWTRKENYSVALGANFEALQSSPPSSGTQFVGA